MQNKCNHRFTKQPVNNIVNLVSHYPTINFLSKHICMSIHLVFCVFVNKFDRNEKSSNLGFCISHPTSNGQPWWRVKNDSCETMNTDFMLVEWKCMPRMIHLLFINMWPFYPKNSCCATLLKIHFFTCVYGSQLYLQSQWSDLKGEVK